jgi:hypothetical protein
MSLITLSQIPEWLQGGFSNYLQENDPDEDCLVLKPLKVDLIFNTLKDILEMINTCIYLQVDKYPKEFYDFALNNVVLNQEIEELESNKGPLVSFNEFTKTPEYQVVKLCINSPDTCELMKAAIKENHMGLIQYIVEELGYCDFYTAAIYGHIHIIDFVIGLSQSAFEYIESCRIQYYKIAIKNNDLKMLLYLKNKFNIIYDEEIILQIALSNGQEDIAIYAINNGWSVSSTNLETASFTCSLEVVQLILEKYPKIKITSNSLNWAISSGKLETARYLYQKGCKPRHSTLLYISDCKNPECAQFAHDICMTDLGNI